MVMVLLTDEEPWIAMNDGSDLRTKTSWPDTQRMMAWISNGCDDCGGHCFANPSCGN